MHLKESAYNFIYDDLGKDQIVFYNSRTGALAVVHEDQYKQYKGFQEKGKEIEDIEPQSLTRGTENLKKELEYSNFLAVCSGNENRGALCCDKSRGNKKLFLTPLNPECNHLIQYSLSGKIQAAETIPDKEDRKELDYELNDILNLNDGKDLKAKRKSALDGMLSVLQKQHKDQDVEECRRKLRELETPRGQKVEYVGILIFWLKKHIQHLESRG